MRRNLSNGSLTLLFVALLALGTNGARAQSDLVTLVASGLTNPRGFDWDADGALFVGIAGSGSTVTAMDEPPADVDANAATGGTPVVEGAGEPAASSDTAGVVRIEDGCPVAVIEDVPSGGPPELGWALGVDDLAFMEGQLYALVGGGGEAYGNPDFPNGVYAVDPAGSMTLVADLSAWFRANPVETPWEPVSPDAQPFGMVASDDVLWIVEANHQQVLTVASDGTITRIVDLSTIGNVAPDAIAVAPEGGVYVGFLSSLPFTDGSAKVVHVSPDGEVTDVWTGLTAVTAIDTDAGGTLYALEMATGNTADAPFVAPGTGKVVRQTGPDSSEDVVLGLSFPVKMKFSPTGALLIGSPAFGANGGEGTIISVLIYIDDPVTVPDSFPSAECAT